MLFLERTPATSTMQLTAWKYTRVGSELLGLTPNVASDEFIDNLGNYFANRGIKATRCEILGYEGTNIRYNPVKEYKLEI